MGVVLLAEKLHYAYDGGVAALTGLDLAVQAGQRHALVGANGAGKTTLLLHLNGTLRPKSGVVSVDGSPAEYTHRGLTAWRQSVGLVFQNPDDQLFAGSVFQDVSFGPLNLGLSDAETRERVEEALHALDITPLRNRPTHMLSFGQKKRASIAGAVAMRPQVLIIDEPLSGLDPSGAEQFLEVLKGLHEAGTTLIIATHDMALAYEWADEVAIMRGGLIVAHGAPPEIMADADMLRECGLRMPWVLEVERALRAAHLLPAGQAPFLSRSDLAAALARLDRGLRHTCCGGRVGGDNGAVAV
ncbi:MAG: ATP-binding cassette domain-containing protein [Thermoleophilia bacterium]